jgi:chemotaxis protein methyltransferase CheR
LDPEEVEIELLLEGIYRYYGYDFRNYSPASIRRRIWHRIHAENLPSISSLLNQVLHNRSIMDKLLGDFLINVTEMYRDPSFFRVLRNKVIPGLRDLSTIRIWHAGCSTGEEVYSMAILLYEEGVFHKTQIYATDMNEKSLKLARNGIFPLAKMKLYTRNYHEAGGKRAFSEYYTADHQEVKFHSTLSQNIVFAHHNLVTDQSFNEFHLIICRNVMIYFNQKLQERVHQLFYESLGMNGFLGLGSKESLTFTSRANCYEGVDQNEKLYRKIR